MTQMRDEIETVLTEYLAVDVKADTWDEAPGLSLIIRAADGAPRFELMPVGEEIWSRGHVHEVLRAVSHATRTFTAGGWNWLQPGEELLGVALFSEGWGVSSKSTGQEWEEVQTYMENGGRLADHPAGVECKMVSAALTSGESVMLTYFRHGEQIEPSPDTEVQGRIPEGLQRLLAAFG